MGGVQGFGRFSICVLLSVVVSSACGGDASMGTEPVGRIGQASGLAPTGRTDTFTILEDAGSVTLSVLSNDTDPENNVLTITRIALVPTSGAPAYTTASRGTSWGTFSITSGGRSLTYLPMTDAHTTPGTYDRIYYELSDGTSTVANILVNVSITGVDDPATALDDTHTFAEDGGVQAIVIGNNDTWIGDAFDNGATDFAYEIVTPPTHGTITAMGRYYLWAVTYVADTNYHGTDTFTYRFTDGDGDVSRIATVTITITPVNDAPVVASASFNLTEDQMVDIDLRPYASDVDGDSLTFARVAPSTGTTQLLANGYTLRCTPPGNQSSGTWTVPYNVSDASAAPVAGTIVFNLLSVNDAPTAVSDSVVVLEDGSATPALRSNDVDVDGDAITIVAATQPLHGYVIVENGNVSYTPAADYAGADSFTYTVRDPSGAEGTATVSVTVTPIDDAFVAAADLETTMENTPVDIDVLANDREVDGDRPLVLAAVTVAPTRGTATIVGSAGSQRVRYAPNANTSGSDSFTYRAVDSRGSASTATVSVNVSNVNNAPVAVADAATTNEDSPIVIDVLSNDTDADMPLDTLSITTWTAASHGSVMRSGSGLRFVPTANYSGTDRFTYTVADAAGSTSTATVSLTIQAVNDAPTAQPDAATITEDGAAVSINVVANDVDFDSAALTLQSVGTPTSGTVSISNNRALYTPARDANGQATFMYTVADSAGATSSALVTVTITAVNDAPVAANDATSLNEDSSRTIAILANDVDPDSGDSVSIARIVTAPTHGVAAISGLSIVYTPNTNYNGSDSLVYEASDVAGARSQATVSITVTSVNDLPVAASDIASAVDNQSTTIDALANDSDVDGDTLTIIAVREVPASSGSVAILNGQIVFSPGPSHEAAVHLEYDIADGRGGQATGVVDIQVAVDTDGDGLSDALETQLGTSVTSDDTDGDNLSDGAEHLTTLTSPVDADTDDDGLLDGQEDVNADGVLDAAETNPLVADTDEDGLQDGTERGVTAALSDDTEIGFVPDADGDTTTDPRDADTDDDGLIDGTEDADRNGARASTETEPSDLDTDADQLSDGLELGLTEPEGEGTDLATFVGDMDANTTTSPIDADSDGGSVLDGFEDANQNGRADAGETDPNDSQDDIDADGDGIGNDEEVAAGLDAFDTDSDDDGLDDGREGLKDTDRDGLIDALDADRDNDGILDGTEAGVRAATVGAGTRTRSGNFLEDADATTTTNPSVADTDADGIIDGTEDINANGRLDAGETDPLTADTDGDGLGDGLEVSSKNSTDPLKADSDSDGLSDGEEDANANGEVDAGETDPNNRDSDGGGVDDGSEFRSGGNGGDSSDDFGVTQSGPGCSVSGRSSHIYGAWFALLALLAFGRSRRHP